MKSNLLILILLAGLISACGSQPTEAPTLHPTEEAAIATQTSTDIPPSTDTAIPPTDTAVPTDTPAAVPSGEISFSNDVFPIIQSRCGACHGGDKGTEEGLDMNSYANLLAGSENGLVIIAGDANGSLLIDMIVENKMPKRGPKLTPPQIQLIIDWVNQGALDN